MQFLGGFPLVLERRANAESAHISCNSGCRSYINATYSRNWERPVSKIRKGNHRSGILSPMLDFKALSGRLAAG